MHNGTSEFGVPDSEISVISSVAQKALFKQEPRDNRRYGAALWHSDIQFEPIPANYTSLRLIQLPLAGGDTLWASGYELYDRFSPAYRKFLEGLTATFSGEGFLKAEAANPDRVKIYEEPRGSPQNVGRALKAVHPVVRTNPVTGWKSIFSVGTFPQQINELTTSESEGLLKLFKETIERSHDLQVRFKWKNENDIGKTLFALLERHLLTQAKLSGITARPSTRPLMTMTDLGTAEETERLGSGKHHTLILIVFRGRKLCSRERQESLESTRTAPHRRIRYPHESFLE